MDALLSWTYKRCSHLNLRQKLKYRKWFGLGYKLKPAPENKDDKLAIQAWSEGVWKQHAERMELGRAAMRLGYLHDFDEKGNKL